MKYALSNVNKIPKAKPSLEWCERVSLEKEVFSGSCCYKSIKMCIQHTIFFMFLFVINNCFSFVRDNRLSSSDP